MPADQIMTRRTLLSTVPFNYSRCPSILGSDACKPSRRVRPASRQALARADKKDPGGGCRGVLDAQECGIDQALPIVAGLSCFDFIRKRPLIFTSKARKCREAMIMTCKTGNRGCLRFDIPLRDLDPVMERPRNG